MNLRSFRIGTRLARGFGLAIGCAALLLVLALVNQQVSARRQSAASEQQAAGLIAESALRGTELVDRAGRTMNEIVSAIRKVSDIATEISAATGEQSSGVSEVGRTVSHMDQATQQNAALVEQSAAAAESLRVQAHRLVETVARFRLRAPAHA